VTRIINRLTPRFVMNAKPKGKPSPSGKWTTYFCDGGGLHLVCTASTDGLINRSWSFKYEIGGNKAEGRKGRRHELGLGPLYDVPLAKARQEAAALREMLRKGIDPLDERRARQRALEAERAKSVTFADDAAAYLALHEKHWSLSHAQQWRTSLATYVYPKIGSMLVSDITSADVLRVVEPWWIKKNVTAGRVLDRIALVLAYATARHHRQGDNPAGNVRATLPKASKVTTVENLAAAPYQAIGEVMAKLREIKTLPALALRFLILCASRSAEVIGCEWSEVVDLAGRNPTWIIPARRMKGRREHRIPLSVAAVELLENLPRQGERPFPIERHAMRNVLAKVYPGVTVHGMRAAFKTWATEQTSYPKILAEAALAHRLADSKTEGVYLRGDMFEKRRRMMQQWADFCSKPAAAKSIGTVVPMHAKVSPHA
jgi:integrase